jgi:hypothetical protein
MERLPGLGDHTQRTHDYIMQEFPWIDGEELRAFLAEKVSRQRTELGVGLIAVWLTKRMVEHELAQQEAARSIALLVRIVEAVEEAIRENPLEGDAYRTGIASALNIPKDQVTEEQRAVVKTLCFGGFYGRTTTLKEALGGNQEKEGSEEEGPEGQEEDRKEGS